GKRFLFRSAASILTALAALEQQPIPSAEMATYVRDGKPGAVIVGSHVKKTTEQLEKLLEAPAIVGIEVDVAHLLDHPSLDNQGQGNVRENLLKNTLDKVYTVHNEGKTPVVYTSRQELTFENVQVRLDFGIAVSRLLMDIVRGLPQDIGFLISKGGITSNDVLSTGLELRTARLLGQILAGVSVVKTPDNHPLFPTLPVVLFPGNVGDADALATVYKRLSKV
ncbi:MAG: four-carbon acid sugar kinase family protein, partial [Microcoleaceae cyanobacterium]